MLINDDPDGHVVGDGKAIESVRLSDRIRRLWRRKREVAITSRRKRSEEIAGNVPTESMAAVHLWTIVDRHVMRLFWTLIESYAADVSKCVVEAVAVGFPPNVELDGGDRGQLSEAEVEGGHSSTDQFDRFVYHDFGWI